MIAGIADTHAAPPQARRRPHTQSASCRPSWPAGRSPPFGFCARRDVEALHPSGTSTLTRKATACFIAGSFDRSSSVEGFGMGSPSSTIPRICSASASGAKRRASSSVLPAVTHPGKSGKLTPKSDFRSLCRNATYSLSCSIAAPASCQLDPGLSTFRLGPRSRWERATISAQHVPGPHRLPTPALQVHSRRDPGSWPATPTWGWPASGMPVQRSPGVARRLRRSQSMRFRPGWRGQGSW